MDFKNNTYVDKTACIIKIFRVPYDSLTYK